MVFPSNNTSFGIIDLIPALSRGFTSQTQSRVPFWTHWLRPSLSWECSSHAAVLLDVKHSHEEALETLFIRPQRESQWQSRQGCPSQRGKTLWKAGSGLLGPSPSNYKPEPGQGAQGSFCWWLHHRSLQIQKPRPAPEAYVGSVSSPAQAAKPRDGGQTPHGGGDWPWAAPEPLSSPCSWWQPRGKAPLILPGRACHPWWVAPASLAAAAMCWKLVPSQQLSAGLLIPPCPWLPALLPRCHWARSHHTSTGTGAAGAARTWQGRQAAGERPSSSQPSSSGWAVVLPSASATGTLRAHGVIFKERGRVEMCVQVYCCTNQWRYVWVALKQAWRNQAPNF